MDKYTKGKNVEEPLEKHKIPIKGLPDDFLWMIVNPGTKMRNVLELAMNEMKTQNSVVWSGSGAAVGKVISCAEIMKRHYQDLYQVNKICFRKVKEYWDPRELEDLDPLVVTRELPTIHILLSKTPVEEQPGYQAPPSSLRQNTPKQQTKPQRKRIDANKFQSFGLRSVRTKNSKRKPHDTGRNEELMEKSSNAQTLGKGDVASKEKDTSSIHFKESNAGPSGVG